MNNINQVNFTDKPLSIDDEKKIKKLIKRRKIKHSINRNMKDFNVLLNIIWVVTIGLLASLICGFIGISYCITIIGVPFGMILFKMVPLVFKPINKRIVLDFKSFWLLNIIWLLSGGFLVAILFELMTVIFYLTIIGIPLGKQTKKIATVFWAPFGADILDIDEFSDDEIEKQAYTLQYIRKNRIDIDFGKLNLDEKNKKRMAKLANYKYPFMYTSFRGSYTTIITILLIILYFVGIMFFLDKINFYDSFIFRYAINTIKTIPDIIHKLILFLLNPLINFLNLFLKIININIYNFVDKLIDFNVILILLLIGLEIIKLSIILIAGLILLNIQRNKIYSYGFATRIELIKLYDSKYILTRKNYDLIHIMYKLYEKEVNEEILKDDPGRKKAV